MKFIEYNSENGKVIEVVSDDIIINSEQDALDLMANIAYLYDTRKIILHTDNFCEDFFILRTGMAGAVMQKFSNYRVQAAIVGEIKRNSESLKAFIRESNRTGRVIFTNDVSTALKDLT
jgi:hypothetical protein